MRITIELNDKLMQQAMRSGGYRKRQDAIEAGLHLLVLQGQAGIRQLRGKISWVGNLEESRLGRHSDR
jgi:Arc/MetJ family transcription regulator